MHCRFASATGAPDEMLADPAEDAIVDLGVREEALDLDVQKVTVLITYLKAYL